MMNERAATHQWRGIILLLLLFSLVGGAVSFWRHFSGASQVRVAMPVYADSQRTSASAPAALASPDASSSSDKMKVGRAKVSARVRVRPGEVAVMAYYDVAPGKLGLTIVTPEAREGGLVSVQLRTLQLADSETLRTRAKEVLPHIFELEKTGVISQARMEELLRSLLEDEDVKTMNYPRMMTQPGQACTIRNGVYYPTGEFLGSHYAVKADSIPGVDGYDLSVDFEHTGTPTEE
jgi:hypothetical protein